MISMTTPTTTIRVHESSKKLIESLMVGHESYEDAIIRVFTDAKEFFEIDRETKQSLSFIRQDTESNSETIRRLIRKAVSEETNRRKPKQ